VAVPRIHHSAEHVDWLVNTRAHPVDMVFTRLCGLVPLSVLGLAAPLGGSASLIPVIVLFLGTVWGFFVHANVRWRFGRLEWLSATPAFHHWHHTNDGPAYVDKNYAAMLPWINRLFGTFYFAATSDRRATAPIIQCHRASSSSCWDRSCRGFLRRSIP
jgi:sterol desaturase/sphingolipid hydroxylase (fatty acid hydroxylase superfamily)